MSFLQVPNISIKRVRVFAIAKALFFQLFAEGDCIARSQRDRVTNAHQVSSENVVYDFIIETSNRVVLNRDFWYEKCLVDTSLNGTLIINRDTSIIGHWFYWDISIIGTLGQSGNHNNRDTWPVWKP